MQALLKLIRNDRESPIDVAIRKIGDVEMAFENAVYVFARRCIEGELVNLSRKVPTANFELIFDSKSIYIKCLPCFRVMSDRITKMGLDTCEMYITSLCELDRTPSEEFQLEVLEDLRNVLKFAHHINTKYNIALM